MNYTDFSWCSKCVGVNSGLKVIFHIKDEKGIIFNPYFTPLELNTEIVYSGEVATLFILPSPLMEKNPPEQTKTLPSGWQLLHY